MVYNKNEDKYKFEKSKLSKKEQKFYVNIFDGLVQLIKDETRKSGNNETVRIKALEDSLYDTIQKYPELLNIKQFKLISDAFNEGFNVYDESRTFLNYLLESGMYGLIEKIGNNLDVCRMQTYDDNILLFDLAYKNPSLTTSFLEKDPSLLSMKDYDGNNFASHIITGEYINYVEGEYVNYIEGKYVNNVDYVKKYMPFIIKSLEDTNLATQLNNDGENLGMLCAKNGYPQLLEIAIKNKKAKIQENRAGKTMEIIGIENGYVHPKISDKKFYALYSEFINKKINEVIK